MSDKNRFIARVPAENSIVFTELVADKGYHSREGLKGLDGGVWKTRIAEPKPSNGYLRWHGDEAARQAVYANRSRLKSDVGAQPG